MSRILLPEWSHQDGILLTWPHAATDWIDLLDEVEQVYIDLAQAITRQEHLLIACFDQAHQEHIGHLLNAAGVHGSRYRLVIAPSNDSWSRDHGPITVRDEGELQLLDFRFNGWGGKYAHDLDDRIPNRLVESGCFGTTPCTSVELVLEGGAIESDGAGTLLTTASCLLAPSRNPHLSRRRLETRLSELIGVDRFLWLHHGQLEGDDTDGHIDTLARFCDRSTIVYVQCADRGDAHYPELARMESELSEFRDRDGNPYRLVPLPWPAAKYDKEGHRLPATYANFLIINGAVLVPTYNDAADANALSVLAGCFPDREIIGIDCSVLIRQHGSLHCVTMQLPSGVWEARSARTEV